MLSRYAPRYLPSFSFILADLGQPSAAHVAAFLGVSERTARRWIAAGEAPRAHVLALFWLTRWGRSEVECAAVNDARMQAQIAQALRAQAEDRAREVERLLSAGDFGAANRPLWRA